MKIISKYKDYYDYISGIYGEDPKLILDRREFDYNTYRFQGSGIDMVTLFIAGFRVEGVYKDGNFYYGGELAKIGTIKNVTKSKYYWAWSNRYYEATYYVVENETNNPYWVLGDIVKDRDKINVLEDCPILIRSAIGSRTEQINVENFPILQDLGLPSFIPPEKIHRWLSDWLSEIENEKERNITPALSDIEKIENKGFDKITSFRPKMK